MRCYRSRYFQFSFFRIGSISYSSLFLHLIKCTEYICHRTIHFQFKHFANWIIIKWCTKNIQRASLCESIVVRGREVYSYLCLQFVDGTSENRLGFWSIWNAPHIVPLVYYTLFASRLFRKRPPCELNANVYCPLSKTNSYLLFWSISFKILHNLWTESIFRIFIIIFIIIFLFIVWFRDS